MVSDFEKPVLFNIICGWITAWSDIAGTRDGRNGYSHPIPSYGLCDCISTNYSEMRVQFVPLKW